MNKTDKDNENEWLKEAHDAMNSKINDLQSKLKAQQELIEEFNKDRRRLYKELTRLNDLLCRGYVYYDDATESVINQYIETGKKFREALAKLEEK